VKRARLGEVQADEIVKPPLLKLSGLPPRHPDGAEKTLDSSAKLCEKFKGAKAGLPMYRGPPPFIGTALVLFESEADDHATAFAQASHWIDAVNNKSTDFDAELTASARASFVTRRELEKWREEWERNKKSHWVRGLFKDTATELKFVNHAEELQKQKALREAEKEQKKASDKQLIELRGELDASQKREEEQQKKLEESERRARQAEEDAQNQIASMRKSADEYKLEMLDQLESHVFQIVKDKDRQQKMLQAEKEEADARAKTLQEKVRISSNEKERIEIVLKEKERVLAAVFEQAEAAREEAAAAASQSATQAAAQAAEESEKERAQKQRLATAMQEEYQDEITKLKEKLKEKEEEVSKCESEELESNVLMSMNFAMKGALGMIEKKLLSTDFKALLEQDMTNDFPPRPKKEGGRRFYVRTFGLMEAYEAHDLGINFQSDLEFTSWTAYAPTGSEKSPLEEEAIRHEGIVVRFREKNETREIKRRIGIQREKLKNGEVEYDWVEEKEKITLKAKLVPKIRRKYGNEKGDRILGFLVHMHNEYLKYSDTQSATAYSATRVLWDGEKNEEMRWEDKVKFYMEHVAFVG